MKRCSTMSCCELEQQVLSYLEDNPRSSIEEISEFLDMNYTAIYRILEGRLGSKSMIGLVNAGYVRAIPGINYKNSRLCYLYELNNS